MTFKEYYEHIGFDTTLYELLGVNLNKKVTVKDCINTFNILNNIHKQMLCELNRRNWHNDSQPELEGDYIIAFRSGANFIKYGWAIWDGTAWDLNCDFNFDTDEILAWYKIYEYEGQTNK